MSFEVDIRKVEFKQSTPTTDIGKFVIRKEGNGINARYFNFSFPAVGSQEKHEALKVNGIKLALTPSLAKRMGTFRRLATNECVTAEKKCELSNSNAKLPLPTAMDWGVFKTEIHEIIFHVPKLTEKEIETILREGLNSAENILLNDEEKQRVFNEIKDIIIRQQQKLNLGTLRQVEQKYDHYGFRLMADNPSRINANYRNSRVFLAGKGNINFYSRKARDYGKPNLEPMKLNPKINSLAL